MDDAPDSPETEANAAALARRAERFLADGQVVEALRAYDRAIELGGATAEIWQATGNALLAIGEYAQAVGAFEAALDTDADNAEAHHNLARAVYQLGDCDRAATHLVEAARRTDAIDPWQALATIAPSVPRFDLAQVRQVREHFAERLGRPNPAAPIPHRRAGKPRVGYLSSWFGRANYMKPVWALINHHDRGAVEVHLLTDSPAAGMDGYRPGRGDRVHETAAMSNDELAAEIADVGIDVLVDLNAYSTPERLGLLCGRVAPVVVAWFNLYATGGLGGIDWIVGDEHVVRPHEEAHYTERVARLPRSYLTFEVGHPTPPVAPPPCRANGHVTFGSLASLYKITPDVLNAWCEILRRAGSARMVLGGSALQSPANREYVAGQFAGRGVEADRLDLLGPADHETFLGYYDRIDVALDVLWYNGGTTTTEAIYQGVPVLCVDGDRWAGRTSMSLLAGTHLGEFIAPDVRQYIEKAVRWAADPDAPERLSVLRCQMRGRLAGSPVCDGAGLAADMEALYRRFLAGPPKRSGGP